MLCPESPTLNSQDTWDWPVVGATLYLNPTRIDFLIRLTCHFGRYGGKGRLSVSPCQSVRREARSDGDKSLAEGDFRGEHLTS